MATITREKLEAERQALVAQEAAALDRASQCRGAIIMVEHLMEALAAPEQPAMTVEELAEAIERGATSH